MNITEYLVAYLREGKSIEIPGIGSLTPKLEEAHFDQVNATLYPARRVIQFDHSSVGQSAFLNYLSEKECIGTSTADRLWRNYVDALKEKLEKESTHVIPGIGTLQRTSNGYSFELDQEAVEQGGIQMLRPVGNVKQYSHTKDPFAIFDRPFDAVEEPVVEEPVVEEPVVEEPAAEEPVVEGPVVEGPAVEEPALEEPAVEEPAVEEPVVEEPVVEEPVVEEPAVEEPAVEEPAPVVAEAPAVEPAVAEAPAVVAPEPAPAPAEPAPEPKAEELEAIETLDKMEPAPATEKPKKKKKTVWILLLILLLLLLVGGGLYYYLMIFKPAQEKAPDVDIENMISDSEGSEEFDSMSDSLFCDSLTSDSTAMSEETTEVVDEDSAEVVSESAQVVAPAPMESLKNMNIFTFNTDGVALEQEEIASLVGKTMSYLHDYVANYVNGRRTPSALEAMNASVEQYIDDRMNQLLDGKEYSVRNFMNYNDYVRNYCMDDIKELKGTQARLLVQRELMDRELLDKLFDEVLASGDYETVAAPVKKLGMDDMKSPVKAPAVNIQSGSKRGFDIIAGFFQNKSNAQVLTANLKRQGCDAYIIQKGEFYYVSMGSAESQTKAEALRSHLQEWYTGDMVIKKW